MYPTVRNSNYLLIKIQLFSKTVKVDIARKWYSVTVYLYNMHYITDNFFVEFKQYVNWLIYFTNELLFWFL